MRVPDQGRDIVNGNAPLFLAFVTDNEKPAIQRQIATVASNLDDAPDHVTASSPDR